MLRRDGGKESPVGHQQQVPLMFERGNGGFELADANGNRLWDDPESLFAVIRGSKVPFLLLFT